MSQTIAATLEPTPISRPAHEPTRCGPLVQVEE
jgi:hypothetical protein